MLASPAAFQGQRQGQLAMAVDEAACPLITYDDFARLDVRVGTIVDAQPFPEARRPAIKLWVALGPALGVRQTPAQLAVHSDPGTLVGTKFAAAVTFPPRQLGTFMSEILVQGLPYHYGAIVLVSPDSPMRYP